MTRFLILSLLCIGLGVRPASGQTSNPEFEALKQYLGTWHAEDQQAQDGRSYHFIYELSWFDPSETIAEMVITQAWADGERMTLWKGFKGLHPSGEVYYHGFSPSGRAGRGHLEFEGENLVTVYEGWGTNGQPVRIRDLFTPVENGAFQSRTTLQAPGSDEWRQAGLDNWRRVGG